MKVVWSPLAINRAAEEASFIGEDKPQAAQRWLEGLFTAVDRLETFPPQAMACRSCSRRSTGNSTTSLIASSTESKAKRLGYSPSAVSNSFWIFPSSKRDQDYADLISLLTNASSHKIANARRSARAHGGTWLRAATIRRLPAGEVRSPTSSPRACSTSSPAVR